jgi:hypothetical protein
MEYTMLSVTRTTAQSKPVLDLLTQVKRTGRPVRVEHGADTFYVLSAEQLVTLLGNPRAELDQDSSFQPEDFGLTQEELAAYEERSAVRRTFVATAAPLDTELQRQLLWFQETQAPYGISPEDLAEQEVLLSAVEDAMLRSLAQTTSQLL